MAHEDNSLKDVTADEKVNITERVYYPQVEVPFADMSDEDKARHICSILGKTIVDIEDQKLFVESLKTQEQRQAIVEITQAFNVNCVRDNVPVLFSEEITNSIVFVPEKRIREISNSEDPFRTFTEMEGSRIVAKVLRSGVVLISDELGSDETRKTIAHELGHMYRQRGKIDVDSNNAVEEGIVEDNAQRIMGAMKTECHKTYQFETPFVRALYKKLDIKTGLALSIADLTKLAERAYPGEQDGYPMFAYLIEDYLDFLGHLRRNSRFIEYFSSEKYKNEGKRQEYLHNIYDELAAYERKWDLSIKI